MENNIGSSKCSYEQFLKIQEKADNKVEYINGEIFYMAPTSTRHNDIVFNLMFNLRHFFKDTKCKVYAEQVAILLDNDNAHSTVQPDVFVVCEGTKRGETYVTVPVIIFEVLSKSTAAIDLYHKLKLYEENGVKEYNILTQEGTIIQYVLTERKYNTVNVWEMNDSYLSAVFNDLTIPLKEIFSEQ
jgi:Uma2 family endonuclease